MIYDLKHALSSTWVAEGSLFEIGDRDNDVCTKCKSSHRAMASPSLMAPGGNDVEMGGLPFRIEKVDDDDPNLSNIRPPATPDFDVAGFRPLYVYMYCTIVYIHSTAEDGETSSPAGQATTTRTPPLSDIATPTPYRFVPCLPCCLDASHLVTRHGG